MYGSVEVALMAIPSFVRLMNHQRQTMRPNDEPIMASWSQVKETPANRKDCAAKSWGNILSLAPMVIITKFCRKMEAPSALMSGDSFGAFRSGR